MLWSGDVLRQDEQGIMIYGFVWWNDIKSKIALDKSGHVHADERTRYVPAPSISDQRMEAEWAVDEQAWYEEHEQFADDPTR